MKLNELRHREIGLSMTYCDTQSQVQSKQKARQVRVTYPGLGLYLRP